MNTNKQPNRIRWSSRWIFILAATGSAVGLGNIWKFPYITGENGGAAFVLIYLCFIAAIGVPTLMAEILLGRRGRHNPADAVKAVALESNRSALWSIAGWLGLLTGFIILSFYAVIAGWSLDYTFLSAVGTFDHANTAEVAIIFNNLVENPTRLLLWDSIIIAIVVYILARGINRGLEVAIRFMFPLMLLLLLVLIIYSISSGYFMQGVLFLFHVDFSALSKDSVLIALGHALFTLSLAMGAIMMYGAYVPKSISIPKVSAIIAIADTFIALLAGLAIFPIVFANNLEPSAGAGLIFQTLPIAFGNMPFGTLFGTLFFLMVLCAALTSAISLLEPAVSWLTEHTRFSRSQVSVLAGIIIWVMSLGTVFSFNLTSDVTLLDKTFFDLIDYITANIMLPLGALMIALFVGWQIKKSVLLEELGMQDNWLFRLWRFSLRYIAPLGAIITAVHLLKIYPILKRFFLSLF